MSLKLIKSENGQGLVETLIAVTVAILVISALISLAVFALRNSRQSSYVAQGTQIAQNQLELIRTYRDNPEVSWAEFADATGGANSLMNDCAYNITTPASSEKCYFVGGDPPTRFVGQNTSTTPFTYYFSLYCASAPGTACSPSGGTIRAYVTVTWNVGGRAETIVNNSDYTNWRLK